MLSNLPVQANISHQLIRNAALNEPRRIEVQRQAVTVGKQIEALRLPDSFPQKRAVFCYDPPIGD